jgi:flagellar hook-associated protein 2
MSTFTVGGLSTGVDYNDLISKLIEVKRQPINILEDKKSEYNQKISGYGDLSSRLSSLESSVDKLKTSYNFYVNTASVSDDTVLDVTASSSASVGNYSISITNLASEEKEVHNGTGLTSSSDIVNNSGSDKVFQYTYAGTQRTITVADGTTLDGLAGLINDDTDNPGVTATVVNDGSNYRLIITGNDTGALNTITIDAGTTLDGSSSTVDFTASAFSDIDKQAADAVFSVDGLSITRSTNSVTDVINGLTINLKKESASATVSVTTDNDAIKEQIEDFVSAYNGVVEFISSNSDYDDATGVSGILVGEGTARNIHNRLRSIVSGSVAGLPEDLNILAQLGITTSYKTGQLEIDATTLDTKLGSNLDDVANLFKDPSSGIATQIYDYINRITSTIDGSITLREKGLKDIIENIDNTIRNMEYRLEKTEDDLVRKFTSLETLVSGFTTIGAYLTNFSVKA